MIISEHDAIECIEKLPTGIPGLDQITEGGLPKLRTTLVAGTAGSAKTVFATQFLAEGIRAGENGVFVTFEEAPSDIRTNMRGLGWEVEQWESEHKWRFVDASPQPEDVMIAGSYDFGALMVRIEAAVREVGARRISLDSLGAVFTQFEDAATVRRELFRIGCGLKQLGITAVMTVERNDEYGAISRYGVEEFVADNVIILRNILDDEKRRRTVEILKFRGTYHQKGEYPFTVIPGKGIVVIPLSAILLEQKSSIERVTSGNAVLDSMCGGGFFRDSIILVTGATGCGKTLMTTEFIAGGAAKNERCILFAFEESRDQLFRNASGWGIDYAEMEARGLLKVYCRLPGSGRSGGSPHPDEGADRPLPARAHRGGQPVRARAGLDAQGLPGIRRRPYLGHQALRDRRAVHGHHAVAAGRHIGDRIAHLDHYRFHHPAALCGEPGRDAARPHRAQDARLRARPGHPRVHH